MLYPINQIPTELSRIEEIPDTFFANIAANQDFGYDLLPDWFKDEYGPLRARGLYKKAEDFFNAIKASGRENDIINGYNSNKKIENHCFNVSSILFYLESIDHNLSRTGKSFFDGLFDNLDKDWFTNYTNTNVLEYLKDFKESNEFYLCPVCANETIKSNIYEARGALDHWFCKAKYPLTAVCWSNLTPLGEGCNRSPVKGQNEIVYTDNNRTGRQIFQYPFTYLGDVEISLNCLREPGNGINDFGEWEFEFTGENANHQSLLDTWNAFFRISNRWVEETLIEFIQTWVKLFSKFIVSEGVEDDWENNYDDYLETYRNSKVAFNLIPGERIHWFFLNFIINNASEALYKGYKEQVKNIVNSY
ncbi:hypothetical protein SAMN04487906_0493 [Zhouia amylolytica]|uniref:Uncharacterized protein n=1 Tax=Zhouia amylolytica TaxID=376730 RepID=A0A1I6PV43_9FLAO|nr:hypothetical protein [Zhouia amylolytica]SFS44101.1 hypothetical protein SAMN04487906_0493 [Zhouia amylolytica]